MYRNAAAASYVHPSPSPSDTQDVLAFHQSLPFYNTTPLHQLTNETVSSLFPASTPISSLPKVFVKDESTRFAATSFKILGASLALHRALCAHLALPPSTNHTAVRAALDTARATGSPLEIVSCTDGNWGKALAACCALYGALPGTILLPRAVAPAVVAALRRVNPCVAARQIAGSYDDAIAEARAHADALNGRAQSYLDGGDWPARRALLLLDTGFEGYARVPGWVTAGYATCLREVDGVVGGRVTAVVCSVGVGSWAHAVVAHYKAASGGLAVGGEGVAVVGRGEDAAAGAGRASGAARSVRVVAVESEVAPGLLASLRAGRITTVETGESIMEGMNCGTPSALAWPVLRDGVDVACLVGEAAAHEAVGALAADGVEDVSEGTQEAKKGRIQAGPCGAAPFAALKQLIAEAPEDWGPDDVIVLFCTEGVRAYTVPNEK